MKKGIMIAILLLVIATVFISGCLEGTKESVCGTKIEKYTSNVKGCDNMDNCRCLSKSWGGLGSCDSCECTKEVSNC